MKALIFLSILISCSHKTPRPDLVERLNKTINPQLEKNLKGAVVGIYDKGESKFLFYGTPAFENSLYEVASITKTFTSLLFSIAIEKGLVKPETKLSEVRPEWKNQKLGQITLIELATHRSGLSRLPCDFRYISEEDPYADYTEKDLINSITEKRLKNFKDCKINSHPTNEILYSNWGAALLGNAIAFKAKSTYGKILKEWITDPLELKDTVIDLDDDQRKRLLQGYNDKLKPTGLWNRKGMIGNGAILSTPRDIMTYARAMLKPDETPLAPAIKRVRTPQFHSIGYNWFFTKAGSIWHNGMNGGYSSFLKVYLHNDMIILYLTNTESEIKCFIEAAEEVPCAI